MLLRYLEDLRFIIGVFFGIIGVILLITGLLDGSQTPEGVHLNLVAGGAMVGISALMLALSIGSASRK